MVKLPEISRHSCLAIQDESTARRFFSFGGIEPEAEPEGGLLARLCFVFSGIPFENLTKIIKSKRVISAASAKRKPDELISDFLDYGTGGTCFSLTAACTALVRFLGFEAAPILADRHYGTDTHSALLIFQDSDLFLLDPGYLIHEPCRLPVNSPLTVKRDFNDLELVPRAGGKLVDLYTLAGRSRKLRLTYKISPLDDSSYSRAWERSFAWEMMTYPVLTRCYQGEHQYLQGNLLRCRDREKGSKQVLSAREQHSFITSVLGINSGIVQEAFQCVGQSSTLR
ncbi:MAG: hypothetical protein ACLFV2_10240 [Desulfurivibrionaceae bacterium]